MSTMKYARVKLLENERIYNFILFKSITYLGCEISLFKVFKGALNLLLITSLYNCLCPK